VSLLPELVSPIFAINENGQVAVNDPTVVSPAIGVTVWSLALDLSLAPTSLYFGDLITFSGRLEETDGVAVAPIASKPIDMIISNAVVTSVIAHIDYTCVGTQSGTYTLAWAVGTGEGRAGVNYFYARSSW